MNKKVLGIALVVVAIIAIGGYAFPSVTEKVTQTLGASAGPEHTSTQTFMSGYIGGGPVNATSSTDTTEVINLDDVFRNESPYSRVEFMPNKADATYTLAATSTFASVLRNNGDTINQRWCNATTTAGIESTFAAGTGWTLFSATTTRAIEPGDCVGITIQRDTDKDISFDFNVLN